MPSWQQGKEADIAQVAGKQLLSFLIFRMRGGAPGGVVMWGASVGGCCGHLGGGRWHPLWHPGRPSLAPLLSECGQTLFSVGVGHSATLCGGHLASLKDWCGATCDQVGRGAYVRPTTLRDGPAIEGWLVGWTRD